MSTIHQERDEQNRVARLIADWTVAQIPVPASLIADYTRARGAVDRLVEEAGSPAHTCPGDARCLHHSHRMVR